MSRRGSEAGSRSRGTLPAAAPFTVLCVAGTDSSGGAGLAADLRTVAALGGHGLAAVTAVTAQSSLAVTCVLPVPGRVVRAQLDAVLGDIGADAVKIGMLGTAAAVRAVAEALERHGARRVVLVERGGAHVLRAPRLATRHTHGTGCVLSTAVACHLARGLPLAQAVALAKRFVSEAIRRSHPLGGGRGPVNPTAAALAREPGGRRAAR